MKILTINSGSSSLKFQLIQMGTEAKVLAKGHIDGIKLPSCKFTFTADKKNLGIKVNIKNHHDALKLAFETLVKTGIIKKYSEIDAAGHRVVHGGEKYVEPTKIDAKVIKEIEKLSYLAPLHNPANLEGIKACKSLLPKTPQIAIFDTAFYKTLPEKSYIYGLPYSLYEKYKIRRYGFHGTSHKYVTEKILNFLKKKIAKIISCHIGNGSSITASIDGKAIETSMGFTPLEGVIMGTRCGSIDPSIVLFLQKELKLKPNKISELLNNESGLKGLSGISQDMRDIFKASKKNNQLANLTIEILAYQIAKYCGSYIAALNGLDAIIFTGGLGEKAYYVREKVINYFEFMGAKLDQKQNQNCAEIISDKKSKIKIFVIPTNEELQIAKETEKSLKKK